jgi:Tfp pilus assembly PilM family ATPase
MMDFRQLKSWKRQQLSSVLGLSLDGGRLEGFVLRRTNGAIQVEQSFSVSLSLDPLTNDPELVGREIRNHLDAAEARERRCVVALPLKWALTAHTKLPDLPEEDVASFLQIEAERGFPSDVTTLHLAVSRCRAAHGESYATQVGIPRNHVALLEQALRAAQLKPLSFSLGITALQPPGAEASNGVLALAIGESNVGLQVTCGGGVMALRTLEGALLTEGAQRQLQADLVAREARITLGQLPAEFRETVRRVRIFGPRDLAQQLADEIELRLEPMGLKVELASKYAAGDFGVQLPTGAVVSPAFSLAASRLTGRAAPFEFLPPKVTPWQQMAARYSSGKLRTSLTAAGCVALLAGGVFLFQQVQLWGLESQWNKIRGNVGQLQDVQAKIAQYRPWFDDPVRALTIMRRLTESFPEDGSVSAKTVEIRDLNTVVCSGVARDSQSLLRTLARLRAMPDVSDASILQTRGQSQSLQFTFNFKWNEAGSHAN